MAMSQSCCYNHTLSSQLSYLPTLFSDLIYQFPDDIWSDYRSCDSGSTSAKLEGPKFQLASFIEKHFLWSYSSFTGTFIVSSIK